MKRLDIKLANWAGWLLLMFVGCVAVTTPGLAMRTGGTEARWQISSEAAHIRRLFKLAPDLWLSGKEFDEELASRYQGMAVSQIESQLRASLDGFPVEYSLTHRAKNDSLLLAFSYKTATESVHLHVAIKVDEQTRRVVVESGFSLRALESRPEDRAAKTEPSATKH